MDESELESIRLLLNARPIEDFFGLSPNEMKTLLYNPFSDESVLQIRRDIPGNIMDQVPFFMLTETLVNIIIREDGIKMTKLKFLNQNTLMELYSYGYWPEWLIESGANKRIREQDWDIMYTCRKNAVIAGIIKPYKDKLILTKKGSELVKNRNELFHTILASFITKLNWAINDRYPEMMILQQLSRFPIFLMYKFGDEYRNISFYFSKVLKAYPNLPHTISMLEGEVDLQTVMHCFELRFFRRLMMWCALAESSVHDEHYSHNNHEFKASPLFKEVFKVE